jgi:hypothetical protein
MKATRRSFRTPLTRVTVVTRAPRVQRVNRELLARVLACSLASALTCALAGCAQARLPSAGAGAAQPSASSAPASSASSPSTVSSASSTRAGDNAREQVRALQQSLSRSSEGLHIQQLPGGIRKIDLQGRFNHATVIDRRDPEAPKQVCIDRPSATAGMF